MVFVLTVLSWKAEFLPMTRSVVIETSCSVYLDLVGYPNVKMYQAAHFLSVHYVYFIAQLKTKEIEKWATLYIPLQRTVLRFDSQKP